MIKRNYNYEYNFNIDICDAITFYTKRICEINEKAFYYRGSDLRFAVERCLYIQCINSKNLYIYYVKKKTNEQRVNAEKLTTSENDIFNIIFKKNSYKLNNWNKIPHSFLKKTIHLFRILRLSFPKKEYSSSNKAQIIFNISNIKFLNYVNPILSYLEKDTYSFQTGSDQSLAILISKQKHKTLEIFHKYKFFNHIFSSIFLSDFLELLNDYDNNIFELERTNPKCIVTVEGNAPQDIISLEVAKKLSIPCYCIQQGWPPYIHNGFRNMNFTEYYVWGQEFKKLLKDYNPKQKFIVTGSPYLKNTKSLMRIKKLKTISFFLQDISPLINEVSFLNFIEVILLCTKYFPNIRIIIKEHPSSKLDRKYKEQLLKKKNITFFKGNSKTLNEILEISDITLSIYSSVILESIAKDKIPIICSFSAIPKYFPYIVKNKCAIEVFNVKDAITTIRNFINKPEDLQIYQNNISRIKEKLFQKTNACEIISSRIV